MHCVAIWGIFPFFLFELKFLSFLSCITHAVLFLNDILVYMSNANTSHTLNLVKMCSFYPFLDWSIYLFLIIFFFKYINIFSVIFLVCVYAQDHSMYDTLLENNEFTASRRVSSRRGTMAVWCKLYMLQIATFYFFKRRGNVDTAQS